MNNPTRPHPVSSPPVCPDRAAPQDSLFLGEHAALNGHTTADIVDQIKALGNKVGLPWDDHARRLATLAPQDVASILNGLVDKDAWEGVRVASPILPYLLVEWSKANPALPPPHPRLPIVLSAACMSSACPSHMEVPLAEAVISIIKKIHVGPTARRAAMAALMAGNHSFHPQGQNIPRPEIRLRVARAFLAQCAPPEGMDDEQGRHPTEEEFRAARDPHPVMRGIIQKGLLRAYGEKCLEHAWVHVAPDAFSGYLSEREPQQAERDLILCARILDVVRQIEPSERLQTGDGIQMFVSACEQADLLVEVEVMDGSDTVSRDGQGDIVMEITNEQDDSIYRKRCGRSEMAAWACCGDALEFLEADLHETIAWMDLDNLDDRIVSDRVASSVKSVVQEALDGGDDLTDVARRERARNLAAILRETAMALESEIASSGKSSR